MPDLLPHPEAPSYRISARAKRVWGKLQDWYGDALAQYGPFPPEDWCDVIDEANSAVERAALSEIRHKHVTFPPRYPEFEAIFARAARPVALAGPSMHERLCAFALKHRDLTPAQLRAPWTYLYRGRAGHAGDPKDPLAKPSIDFAVAGVVIPADGEHHPGYRVLCEDLVLAL